MKKTDNHSEEKKQRIPVKPEGVTDLTDQDLQQVQGGMANQVQVERNKKGGGDPPPPPPK